MNALNTQVQEELRAAAAQATADDDVRAVVVYGGEKVFAAGADIKEMADMSYADMSARAGALSSAFDAVARIPKPVVAAITGYALGGGCELALACDWRVVAEDAKLGQPEIKLGIIPGAGGTQRLARLVGPARAKDLIMSGRMVDADGGAARSAWPTGWCRPAEVYDAARGAGRSRYVDGPGAGAAGGQARRRRRPGPGPRRRPGLGEPAVRRRCSPPRTAARAWPRSSTSASRSSPAADARATCRSRRDGPVNHCAHGDDDSDGRGPWRR